MASPSRSTRRSRRNTSAPTAATSSSRTVHVGTAGWAIPRAQADRFPAGASGLIRYAARLDAAEIDSSFYRSHRPDTWARWAASVPPGFRFAVKVPRAITHERELGGVARLLRAFLIESAALGDARGPLLVQLPPKLAFDPRAAARFFETFRRWYEGAIVCEPRHRSWADMPADRLLRRFRVARVAADPPRIVEACAPGGCPDIVYYRLHGSARPYFSSYPADRLEALAETLAASPVEAWCIFDNTGSGAAAANALDLSELLARISSRDRPPPV